MSITQDTAPVFQHTGSRWGNRSYAQKVADVGTATTGPRHEWTCTWKLPNGATQTCAEGPAKSASHGLQLVADHMRQDHEMPAIPWQPERTDR